jgi:hypothetical protein
MTHQNPACTVNYMALVHRGPSLGPHVNAVFPTAAHVAEAEHGPCRLLHAVGQQKS